MVPSAPENVLRSALMVSRPDFSSVRYCCSVSISFAVYENATFTRLAVRNKIAVNLIVGRLKWMRGLGRWVMREKSKMCALLSVWRRILVDQYPSE